jgi:hypothetical protein
VAFGCGTGDGRAWNTPREGAGRDRIFLRSGSGHRSGAGQRSGRIVLNGTSSVLYGTVPELAHRGDVGRAFALFYTGVIGAGGLAPIAYGAIADHSSRTIGVVAASLTAAAIVPMVLALSPFLNESSGRIGRPMIAKP